MNFLFKFFLATVMLAPLPLGAVYLWAWSLLATLTALMLMAWAALIWRAGQAVPVPLARIWPSAALFALVVAWAMIQTASWTPESWHHPIWKAAGDALEKPLAGAISVAPFEGWAVITRLLMYAGVFWLSLQTCRDRDRAALALKVFAIAGAIYAGYGVAVLISGSNTILWLHKTSYFDLVTGTFVNRNNFATFAGISLLATSAYLVQRLEKSWAPGPTARESLRRATVLLAGRHWGYVFGWVVIFLALLLTQSRGGVAAAVLAHVLFGLLLSLRAAGRRQVALRFVLVLALLGGGVLASTGGLVLDRIGNTRDLEARGVIFETTLDAIKDNPVLGTGLGSYREVYRLYAKDDIGTSVQRAHNTYLENALELGIPACAALVAAIALLTWRCVLGVRARRRDSIYAPFAVSVAVLAGAHSLIDFPLQIPAVSVIFAAILGLGVAQAFPTRNI